MMQTSMETHTILFCLVVLVCGIVAEDDKYRLLPNYIISHQYIDLILPHAAFTADSSNYSGYVEITFQVIMETDYVQLHASSNIDLQNIQLNNGDLLINHESFFQNFTTDILTINYPSILKVGEEYTLVINFKALLLEGGGFYKVSYIDDLKQTQYIATTQFQATNARKAFPCFDEPIYKSTFAFNLTYPSEMTAWANSPSEYNHTDTTTNLTTTQFAITPKMSTYLVAFTVSKYTCDDGELEGSSDYVHRVCSRSDKTEARKYAMDVTPKVIEHLNSYTAINYSASGLSKLDQIAVPGKNGAMENWGLVIYGESSLLYDNTSQNLVRKQGIAGIISHELAHQWFGNLVTCKWWSETFLNEGFATMFQYYTTHYVEPEFEMEKQFVIRVLQPILTSDGALNAPALRSNASTQSEVSAKFGGYTYSKGGSVLRMIEHIIGRHNFMTGVQKYLKDKSYQSAEPQDLWDAIQNVTENSVSVLMPSGKNLSDVIENWINKGGYPVVTVSLVGDNIIVSQQRFLSGSTDTDSSTWYVPVTYSTAALDPNNEDTTPRGWVTPDENFKINNHNANDWIVVNNQQTGFYRVNYDTTLWTNLANALKQTNFSGIHVVNRAQVVQDSDMLARAGYLSYADVLRNVEFLANETEYFTWYPAVTLFSYLLQKTGSTTQLGAALTNHFGDLLASAAKSVPLSVAVDEDKHIFTLNQVQINTYACKFGNTDCTEAAKTLFATYKNSHERPNINIRSIVYCNALRYSVDPIVDWSFLYDQYQNESVSDDASTIWAALGCSTNTTVLKLFLSKVLENDDAINSSQYTSIFSSIYNGNEVGINTALEYFIDNYQNIIKVYSEANLNIGNILTGLGSVFTTTSQIEKLEAFGNSTTDLDDTIKSSITSALSSARANQEIINKHKSVLHEYFGLSEEATEKPTEKPTDKPTEKPTDKPTEKPTDKPNSTEKPNTDGATTLGKCELTALLLISIINVMYFHV